MSSDTFLRLSIPRLGDNSSLRIEEQARARGHAVGYTDGLRAAQADHDVRIALLEADHAAARQAEAARIDHAISLLAAAADALNARTLPVLADSHAALAAAAGDLAEAILGVELADHEHSARAALHRALTDVDTRLVHTVRLHPDDLALLTELTLLGELHLPASAGVDLVADAALRRGDAVTEFVDGYLDARIETALQRARAALRRENS